MYFAAITCYCFNNVKKYTQRNRLNRLQDLNTTEKVATFSNGMSVSTATFALGEVRAGENK